MTANSVRAKVRRRVAALMEGIPGIVTIRASRTYPADKRELPCLMVYSTADRLRIAQGSAPGRRIVARQMTVDVCVVIADAQKIDFNADEQMDGFVAEIESRMATNPHLRDAQGGDPLATDCELAAVAIGLVERGSSLTGASCTFLVTAHHREGDPNAVLLRG